MRENATHGDGLSPQTRRLPCALRTFEEIALRLQDRKPVLFLDFDGTLARIVPHPSQARLEEGLHPILERLVRRIPVAVISGRSAQDVKELVQLASVQIVGDHGLVFLEPDGERLAPPVRPAHLEALEQAAHKIQATLAPVEGAWVETKRCTFAVHTRQVHPKNKPHVLKSVEKILAEDRLLVGQKGKEVVDVRPRVEWDKGDAVSLMLRRFDTGGSRPFPLVFGDDTTDEPAFEAARRDGAGVLVGDVDRKTAAGYSLADPAEVKRFLARLLQTLGPQAVTPGPPVDTREGPHL